MVETSYLVHLSLGNIHFLGERDDMRAGDTVEFVLNQMQMFNQQIPLTRSIGKQIAYTLQRVEIDTSATHLAFFSGLLTTHVVSIHRKTLNTAHGIKR
jgi:hypothetical protein